jgi:hypothetical protein
MYKEEDGSGNIRRKKIERMLDAEEKNGRKSHLSENMRKEGNHNNV